MDQQRNCSVTALMLLAFFTSSQLAAEPPLPSPPAKQPTLSRPSALSFFEKPEVDPQLAVDPRLDRKVTLDGIGTPLTDVLQKVSVTGLPLDCAPDCADTKLQVRIKDRPLRALMTALAQLAPGTWKREGKGYCLYTDPKAMEYEDHWWQLYGLERERVLAVLRVEILTEMQQKPYHATSSDPNPENISPEMMDMTAQGQEFWYLLPQPLQEQIAGQIVDTAYYRSGQIFQNRPIEGAVVVPFQSLPPQAQTDILASGARLLNHHRMGNPVAVSFNNSGFSVQSQIATSDGRWHGTLSSLSVQSAKITPTLALDHTGLPELMKQMGTQSPETWKPLAAYQGQHIWPNDLPRAKPDFRNRSRRPEILKWLASQANLEFVSDYYSIVGDPLSEAAKKRRLTRPLKQELDFQAAQEDMSWKARTDGLYLFRDNRWYRDDKLEVPEKTLHRLLDTLQAAEASSQTPSLVQSVIPSDLLAPQLDLGDSIVEQLTPWQIPNGLSNYVVESGSNISDPLHPAYTLRPFGQIAEIVLSDYHTYLFHSTLDASQNSALEAGNLPISALDTAQARQAVYLLPDLQIALKNESHLLLSLRPDDGPAPVELGYDDTPPSPLTLQRVRLVLTPAPDSYDAPP